MTLEESKLEILKKVESGTLTVEEGADLLAILDGGSVAQPEPEAEVLQGSVLDSTPVDEPAQSRSTAVPAG